MFYLHHAIYENDDDVPTLVHVFPGETMEDAERILKIHATWDAFLNAAITTGEFQGMQLRTEVEWSQDDFQAENDE